MRVLSRRSQFLHQHNTKGLELIQASTSNRVVSNSHLEKHLVPNVLRRDDLTEFIRRCHQPHHHGARGAMNLHLGAKGPNICARLSEAETNVWALSE